MLGVRGRKRYGKKLVEDATVEVGGCPDGKREWEVCVGGEGGRGGEGQSPLRRTCSPMKDNKRWRRSRRVRGRRSSGQPIC
jgi:hypothetical protein